MYPAEQIRIVLAECREQGLTFKAAWYKATRFAVPEVPSASAEMRADIEEMRALLPELRPCFKAAYENRAPTNWEVEFMAKASEERLDALFGADIAA